VTAWRALRDVAAEQGRWREAIDPAERVLRFASRDDRAVEASWLAGAHYETGRALLDAGDLGGAVARLREALRVRPDFVPAALLLGDTHLKSGDSREALRTWERALETTAAVPVLDRLAQLHRAEGRPARTVAVYEQAAARHPDDLAIAFGLGRAYFELAMLDEAAEQFEKLEVRAPDSPAVHAYLGAIFERHGQIRDAFDEFRRALSLAGSVDWPHHCATCGATHARWFDRCRTCRRWNTCRP
jgi:tetratricopeptide (TPR) repeat protein